MESFCVPRDQPEKERVGEGEKRERESTPGSQISKKLVQETGLRNWSILYFSGKLFMLLVVHRDQMDNIKLCRVSSPDPYQDQAFFSANLSVYKRSQVIYIIFWPKGLLTILWLFS